MPTLRKNLILCGLTTVISLPCFGSAKSAPGILMQCPSVKAFSKNHKTLYWSAKGGWQGYQKSFATKLKRFLGAQWQGVAIGQITCLYQPSDKLTFPVEIDYNKITFEPRNKPWSKNQHGFRNCVSHNPKDCAFYVRPKKAKTNPYAALTKYKATHHQQLQQGF